MWTDQSCWSLPSGLNTGTAESYCQCGSGTVAPERKHVEWVGGVSGGAQRISANPHLFFPLVLSPTTEKLICSLPSFRVCVHAATYTCEHTCTHAATQTCVYTLSHAVTHAATLTHAQARIHTCRVTHVQTQPLTQSHTRTHTPSICLLIQICLSAGCVLHRTRPG